MYPLNLVACISPTWHIGKNGQLLGHVPGDLKGFKELTKNSIVIMGWNTAISLPDSMPLKDRPHNVVISKPRVDGNLCIDDHVMRSRGFTVMHNLEEAILWAQEESANFDLGTPAIIGGGQIYEAAIKSGLVTDIHLTIAGSLPAGEGDVSLYPFLQYEPHNWKLKSVTPLRSSENNVYHYQKVGKVDLICKLFGATL